MRAPSLLATLIWLSPATACAGSRSGPYTLELVDENGDRLPTYTHGSRTYVLGHEGQHYSLRIHNRSPNRVEFVASVDGRDVLEGAPANWSKRGYVVNARDQVVIEGFRLNHDAVAAFRFGSVRDSYAERMGDGRDVGVIGVAVFTERERAWQRETGQVLAAPRSSNGLGSGVGSLGAGQPPRGLLGGAHASVDLAGRSNVDARVDAHVDPRVESEERPGLGTEFGERRQSHVNEVDFERASYSPEVRLTLRYDDREGLRALGIDLDRHRDEREADRRENAQPFRESFCSPPPGWGR